MSEDGVLAPVTPDALDVLLRDGTALRLRPPLAEDADALSGSSTALSERSFYLRFHGSPTVRPSLVEPFLEPDWAERGALVGGARGGDGRHIVALASYARLRDPAAAEVAFTVADDQQGRGIGTRMLEQLAERAAAVGIERFVADVMGENAAMMRVFEDAGFGSHGQARPWHIRGDLPDRADRALPRRVDERDHLAVVASLRPFFAPASVAVIGASTRREAIGGHRLPEHPPGEFQGAAYPVNRGRRTRRRRHGLHVDRGASRDRRPRRRLPAGRPCARPPRNPRSRRGIRALCVISAGFAEIGEEGRASAGAAARARACARRPARRAELPRHRGRRAPA